MNRILTRSKDAGLFCCVGFDYYYFLTNCKVCLPDPTCAKNSWSFTDTQVKKSARQFITPIYANFCKSLIQEYQVTLKVMCSGWELYVSKCCE